MKSFPLHVLFLCEDNAVLSPMAEVLLRDLGGKQVRAFSAGTHPAGIIAPEVTRLLDDLGHDSGELFSKSLRLFTEEGAPHVDLVVNISSARERSSSARTVLGPVGALRVHWDLSLVTKAAPEQLGRGALASSFSTLGGAIRQVLQPSWDDLTTRDIQRLFQVAGLAGSNLVYA